MSWAYFIMTQGKPLKDNRLLATKPCNERLLPPKIRALTILDTGLKKLQDYLRISIRCLMTQYMWVVLDLRRQDSYLDRIPFQHPMPVRMAAQGYPDYRPPVNRMKMNRRVLHSRGNGTRVLLYLLRPRRWRG
ncbi:unnamed protein product [Euphydryas editha]|uniref:Uncharacterized protein n=1 Tax=Euphydryas editha TaxID=104508 RepID=A0AAU9UDN3_EUPED|nr:unnamed protein product [Euphydryas editha]